MRTWMLIVGLAVSPAWSSCKEGFEPSDTPGVCQEKASAGVDQSKWVSDEKPPADKMPSWQREGIKVIDAPSMVADDEKMDQEKAQATFEGKKAAGIK